MHIRTGNALMEIKLRFENSIDTAGEAIFILVSIGPFGCGPGRREGARRWRRLGYTLISGAPQVRCLVSSTTRFFGRMISAWV